MKNLFCIVLAATFAFTASLHAQDKDKDEKDKAAVKDKDEKDKDKDKDKEEKDKDKDKEKKVEVVKVTAPIETYVLVPGGFAVRYDLLIFLCALLVVIVGVWYTLLRHKGGDEGAPPPV